MCLICVEMDKNKLEPWEASRNLKEMASNLEEEHVKEVMNKILELFLHDGDDEGFDDERELINE